MRSVLIALILLTGPRLFGDETTLDSVAASFDASYAKLEKKIGEIKDKGEKINDQTRKELDDLMVQMNHEHAELKRELDAKNQELQQKIDAGKDKSSDWSTRVDAALHEFGDGCKRAWGKLKKDQE